MSSGEEMLIYLTMTTDDAELVMSALMCMAQAYAEESKGDDEERQLSITASFIAVSISKAISDVALQH